MAKKDRTFAGTGRRKSSVARVILTPGTGKITVNGKDVNEYMPFEVLVMDLKQPLEVTNNLETFDKETMGTSCKEIIKNNFTWNIIVKKYKKIFK